LGTSFGRGGATTFQQDLKNSDCIVIMGSNMAECHPVGFQWVIEAKERGAKVIHVDPRFTRTSAVSDVHVALRAGTDIAFLGGIIRYILENGREFRDYVARYTNAAVIVGDDFRDTEDLDGLFSGFDPETGTYDDRSWQYRTGTGPEADPTLTHPRCVFQLLKRHYSRYTPDVIEDVCGVRRELFLTVAEALCDASGPERTAAFCYAVGWTQHTVGVQYIRTAAIVQLLLGNIGRPGGGILALRGHASIQGSTDIPTLYNLLPGYLPMPRPDINGLDEYVDRNAVKTGVWGRMDAYVVSLLKAWWGDAATVENDFCFGYLPRISGDHSTYQTTLAMIDGAVHGYFVMGENPAVGSANGKLQRRALAAVDWLVVRDFSEIETASFWYDSPEIETGELQTETIGTEVFFMPAAAHTEKDGSYTNTQRLLQWHHKAVEPPGDARSELWFMYHLGLRLRERLAGSTDPRDRAVLDLTWDYPTEGLLDEPSAEAVLREVNGRDVHGDALATFGQLRADGSTTCGCWIYCGCFAGDINQAARRRPGRDQDWVAPEWGWAWPANRRMLYNRASADPDGRPWSERKRYLAWNGAERRWTGPDVADFAVGRPPDYLPAEGAEADEALRGDTPFVMQADGLACLYVPAGLTDGPLPTHYEPHESPFRNPLYPVQANPTRQTYRRAGNAYHPVDGEAGAEVFPYVMTTYRLTEHHTSGAMSRNLAHLAELQPEMFCEVSPELAAERGLEPGGFATIVTARAAIEARVTVTDRVAPLVVQGRTLHQVGLPYHWGQRGLSTGDSANDLFAIALDSNVYIQEVKAATCDIRPGRRPHGRALLELVAQYRRRAGIETDAELNEPARDRPER
jgi:formate dehydrogenase major subunit